MRSRSQRFQTCDVAAEAGTGKVWLSLEEPNDLGDIPTVRSIMFGVKGQNSAFTNTMKLLTYQAKGNASTHSYKHLQA